MSNQYRAVLYFRYMSVKIIIAVKIKIIHEFEYQFQILILFSFLTTKRKSLMQQLGLVSYAYFVS